VIVADKPKSEESWTKIVFKVLVEKVAVGVVTVVAALAIGLYLHPGRAREVVGAMIRPLDPLNAEAEGRKAEPPQSPTAPTPTTAAAQPPSPPAQPVKREEPPRTVAPARAEPAPVVTIPQPVTRAPAAVIAPWHERVQLPTNVSSRYAAPAEVAEAVAYLTQSSETARDVFGGYRVFDGPLTAGEIDHLRYDTPRPSDSVVRPSRSLSRRRGKVEPAEFLWTEANSSGAWLRIDVVRALLAVDEPTAARAYRQLEALKNGQDVGLIMLVPPLPRDQWERKWCSTYRAWMLLEKIFPKAFAPEPEAVTERMTPQKIRELAAQEDRR
jgi:Tfp pilus assembly major pilin PilA